MKEKLRKIFSWIPDQRLTAVCAVAALALLLAPLFRIAIYSVPWYDDYSYGGFVKNFLNEQRSLKSALDGMVYCVRTMWYAWQGTFSSVALMSLVPFVWGEQYYFLGSVFVLSILLLALFVFTKVLLRDVLGANWSSCLIVQSIVIGMVYTLIYTANSAFYWYNAAIHYVGMHSFMLLLAAAWIRLLKGKGRIKAVFLVLWTLIGALLSSGANFVTTLQGLILGLTVTALGILFKNKKTFLLLPSLAVYVYGFYKNVSAPGNAVRGAYYQGMGAAEAVMRSFVEAFRFIPEYTRLITVVIMILLAPAAWAMVKKVDFKFRFPGLVLLWSICFYATGYTPSLYAMGNPGLSRTLNVVKITFQLLLVLNEVYWIGWIQRRMKEKDRIPDKGAMWWFYPLIGAAVLCLFVTEKNQAGTYAPYGAYYYVHTGLAYNFYQEYLNRVETVKHGGPDVVVEPYSYRPWFLQTSELGSTPDTEPNRMMADWYGKNSISCYHIESE